MFGEAVLTSGTTVNPFRFVGQIGYYFDSETVSYYVRVRTYDFVTGRWNSKYSVDMVSLQRDPVGSLDLNSAGDIYIYSPASTATNTPSSVGGRSPINSVSVMSLPPSRAAEHWLLKT